MRKNLNFVINTDFFYDNLIDKSQKNEDIIAALGYPNLNVKKLFNNIRKYDTEDDWTFIEPNFRLKKFMNIM